MFFSIRDLELRKTPFQVDLAPGEIDFLEPKIRQTSALHAEGVAELANESLEEIRVQGWASVAMETECDRCLDPATCAVDAPFDLYYLPEGAEPPTEEVELGEAEAEVGFYSGAGVDLNDILREHILLSLPMQRLCREDCKGICPACGQNRNTMDCQCEARPADDRWRALKDLKA